MTRRAVARTAAVAAVVRLDSGGGGGMLTGLGLVVDPREQPLLTRELAGVLERVLDLRLGAVLLGGWRRHRDVRSAARRTAKDRPRPRSSGWPPTWCRWPTTSQTQDLDEGIRLLPHAA